MKIVISRTHDSIHRLSILNQWVHKKLRARFTLNLPTLSEFLPQGNSTRSLSETLHSYRSVGKSGIKPQNQRLWSQFDVKPLHGKLWRPKRGRRLLEDRKSLCIQCCSKTADCARATSPTNMNAHLAKNNIGGKPAERSRRELQDGKATIHRFYVPKQI